MKRIVRLTEGQLYKLIRKVINEATYSEPTDANNDDKQQFVSLIIEIMRDTFLTSVWDVDGYVELYVNGEDDPRGLAHHIQVINGNQLMVYDDYVGNKWYPDELDAFTLMRLADYMYRERERAQNNGIVDDIKVSTGIKGMMLPYRFIGDERIMPTACKEYTHEAQFVSADDFYYKDFEDALSYEEEEDEYTNESLAHRVTKSVMRKLRRV